MSLKELFKSNVFRACIIILLYVLYALFGSFSEYLFPGFKIEVQH